MLTADPGDDSLAEPLPEHLRLPDLSAVRTIIPGDLHRWIQTATTAFHWGRERRNGAWRRQSRAGTHWVDADRHWHSPDPWTPCIIGGNGLSAAWYQRGQRARPGDQPAVINAAGLQWWDREQIHRVHAPAVLRWDGAHSWWWHSEAVPTDHGLPDLLTRAWTDKPLTGADAHTLLDQASTVTDHAPVTPTVWVAHVLAARPDAATWTADTRAWLALLTA